MIVGLLAVLLPLGACFYPVESIKSAVAELADVERALKAAGQGTDAESLVQFFRQRTLTPTHKERLSAAIRRLGDDSFEARQEASAELVAAGAPAVPLLQAALADPDLEVVRRAERCIEAIRRGPGPHVAMSAARLLGLRKPPGAAQVLLDYLPFADDEYVQEAVFASLAASGTETNGTVDRLFEQILDDPEPLRRVAAARVLGQSNDPGQRRLVHRLLGDPLVAVRLQAARTLLVKGDKAAVSPLITLLTEAPAPSAWEAEELLGRLAGPTAPDVRLDLTEESGRRLCRAAWETWWRTNETTLDLSRLTWESRLLGLTLIADLDKGRVVEVGRDHGQRWRVDGFGGPVDVELLPSGRILVAENHSRKVTERDKTGRICWEKTTSAFPASCQRLPNGNTFIATYNELLEVTGDGRETFKLARADGVYCARKQRSGRILLVNSAGRVATLDPSGKEIAAFETGGVANWSSLEALPNGNCLVCGTGNKVIEFDPRGRRVWECTVQNAVCATRLPNGNTLVCSSEGRRVVEVDRTGKEIWEHRTEGRPWHVRRR
jgi:HEAT repeat protein